MPRPRLDRVDDLRDEFRRGREDLSTPEKRKEFREKKRAFVDARRDDRRAQEADPAHPRGKMMIAVLDDGEEN